MVDDWRLLDLRSSRRTAVLLSRYVPTLPELLSVFSSMPLPYAKVPPRPSKVLDRGFPDSIA